MSKENLKQLTLFPEETVDLSPSITIPSKPIPHLFDERTRNISNLNRSIRDWSLGEDCQLSLTFDQNYSKLRMFLSPKELEEKIQKAIFSTPNMRGRIVFVEQALLQEREYLEKLKLKEEKPILIPLVFPHKFDKNFQMEVAETGITLELTVSRFSEIAFHISCRFS